MIHGTIKRYKTVLPKEFHICNRRNTCLTVRGLLHWCVFGISWESTSVCEPTEWLSEVLFPSPSFFSLLRRLSVSRNPYLLLITGTSTGSPALDLKAPVPRLHDRRGEKKKVWFNCSYRTQLRFWVCFTQILLFFQPTLKHCLVFSWCILLPFTRIAFTKFIVFPKKTISIVARDFFSWLNVP